MVLRGNPVPFLLLLLGLIPPRLRPGELFPSKAGCTCKAAFHIIGIVLKQRLFQVFWCFKFDIHFLYIILVRMLIAWLKA